MSNRISKALEFQFLSYAPDVYDENIPLSENHGVLYFFKFPSGKIKTGELTTVNNVAAYDAFVKSYQSSQRGVDSSQDYTVLLLIVFDKNTIKHNKTRGYDKLWHEYVNKHHSIKKVEFYYPGQFGDGNIELLENYDHATQYHKIKELLDLFFSEDSYPILSQDVSEEKIQELVDEYGRINKQKNKLETEIKRLKERILEINKPQLIGHEFLINITETLSSRFDQAKCIKDVGEEQFAKWKTESLSKVVRVKAL